VGDSRRRGVAIERLQADAGAVSAVGVVEDDGREELPFDFIAGGVGQELAARVELIDDRRDPRPRVGGEDRVSDKACRQRTETLIGWLETIWREGPPAIASK